MKKLLLAVLVGMLSIPALADSTVENSPEVKKPVLENQQGRPGDFKQARKKQEAQLKATQEKMKKLVEEYTKLKPGKKKEAKKTEIIQAVSEIHEQQLKFKEKHLADFEKRLNQMKSEWAEQNTAQAKQSWVEERTEKLIEKKGDMRVLFDTPRLMGNNGFPGPQHKRIGKPGPNMHPGMKPGVPPQGMKDRPENAPEFPGDNEGKPEEKPAN